jgi:ribosomal protein S18 acetylase RimI-like enzyme
MPKHTPTLRQATAADATRVARLRIDTRAVFLPYVQSAHREDEIHAWGAAVLLPSGGVSVAEIDGPVIGAPHTQCKGTRSWITQMAVDAELIARGIGTSPRVHVMQTMSLPIRLHTFQANQRARRCYERHGFVAIAITNGESNEERCPDVLYELKDQQ